MSSEGKREVSLYPTEAVVSAAHFLCFPKYLIHASGFSKGVRSPWGHSFITQRIPPPPTWFLNMFLDIRVGENLFSITWAWTELHLTRKHCVFFFFYSFKYTESARSQPLYTSREDSTLICLKPSQGPVSSLDTQGTNTFFPGVSVTGPMSLLRSAFTAGRPVVILGLEAGQCAD